MPSCCLQHPPPLPSGCANELQKDMPSKARLRHPNARTRCVAPAQGTGLHGLQAKPSRAACGKDEAAHPPAGRQTTPFCTTEGSVLCSNYLFCGIVEVRKTGHYAEMRPIEGPSVPHRVHLPDQVAARNNSGMRVANCEGTRRVSDEPLSAAPVLALEADAPTSLRLRQMHRPASTVLSVISARLIASRSPSLMFIFTAAVSCAEQPGAARAPILGPVVMSWEASWSGAYESANVQNTCGG